MIGFCFKEGCDAYIKLKGDPPWLKATTSLIALVGYLATPSFPWYRIERHSGDSSEILLPGSAALKRNSTVDAHPADCSRMAVIRRSGVAHETTRQLILACLGMSFVLTYIWWMRFRVLIFRQDLLAIRDTPWDQMIRRGTLDEPSRIPSRDQLADSSRTLPLALHSARACSVENPGTYNDHHRRA